MRCQIGNAISKVITRLERLRGCMHKWKPPQKSDGFHLFRRGTADDVPVAQLHPLVAPHVSHFSQVPLRTIVKFWHSVHMLPV